MLRFGYNTNGFTYHSLYDALEIIAECGYDGVSITLSRHHLNPSDATARQRARLRDKLRELRLDSVLETVAWYSLDPWHKYEPSLISVTDRDRRIEYTQLAIDIAAQIGADTVTVLSGKLRPGASPDDAFDALAAGCRNLADYADMRGVKLALQPRRGMFIERLNQYALLADAVDHENFWLALDVGDVTCCDRYRVTRALERFGDRVATARISDVKDLAHKHLPFGEGEIPFQEILRTCERIGYGGLLCAEFAHYAKAAPAVAQQSIRYLRSVAPKPIESLSGAEAEALQF